MLPQDDPLLISDDLPAGYSPDAPDDSLYTNPASGYVTQAEHDRLAALLEAAPTTEAEDQALLDSGLYTGGSPVVAGRSEVRECASLMGRSCWRRSGHQLYHPRCRRLARSDHPPVPHHAQAGAAAGCAAAGGGAAGGARLQGGALTCESPGKEHLFTLA